MRSDHIDWISSYCDRWCERCAFTSRCSSYSVSVATAMCDGDVAAAIQLAVGHPQPVGESAEHAGTRESKAELPSGDDIRDELAAEARIDEHPLMRLAFSISILASKWLRGRHGVLVRHQDPVLHEAVDVAAWDAPLIGAKLNRALRGRDDHQAGTIDDDHPIQNDWNGSAKVALISIARSEPAWRLIADATGDATPREIANALVDLNRMTHAEFPRAIAFIRPGFDTER